MSYQIVSKYIKDISFEIPNAETLLMFEDHLPKYNLKFDITSKALKNNIIQVDTILKFENDSEDKRKARIEINYAALVRLEQQIKDKLELEKIILIKIPTDIYPELFELFTLLIEKSGLTKLKLEKKIDFEELYNSRKNQK